MFGSWVTWNHVSDGQCRSHIKPCPTNIMYFLNLRFLEKRDIFLDFFSKSES